VEEKVRETLSMSLPGIAFTQVDSRDPWSMMMKVCRLSETLTECYGSGGIVSEDANVFSMSKDPHLFDDRVRSAVRMAGF
jgi:hypothetical protein